MKLAELCSFQDVVSVSRDPAELIVFGVTNDSRDVRFGFVFCATPSHSPNGTNGVKFCSQAAERGAQAIIISEIVHAWEVGLSEYELEKVVIVQVRDVESVYARLAAHFYASRPGFIAGVTGTNGKTSTVSFLRDIWTANNHEAVSLGTLGVRGSGKTYTDLEANLTTFDAKTLHIMLAELSGVHGVTHVAAEVSSHALHQRRVDGVTFEAVAFTNLTQDHLDYHPSLNAYFAAKSALFRDRLKVGGTAVINVDDPRGTLLASSVARDARVMTVSTRDSSTDLRLLSRKPTPTSQHLEVAVLGTRFDIEIPVAGSFQAQNILVAVALAIASDVPAEKAVSCAGNVAPVPGRLELAGGIRGAAVYVDYAHTPDALANVLRSLRPHVGKGGELGVVFGCGGDRDPGKRSLMGHVASDLADRVYVTDDNPRSEDPALIRAQVMAGVSDKGKDAGERRVAIERAIEELKPGDILVVAGKGHEDYQITAVRDSHGAVVRDQSGRMVTKKSPFSDLAAIRDKVHSTQ